MKIRLSAHRLSLAELAFIVLLCAFYLIPTAALNSIALLVILILYALYLYILDSGMRPLIVKMLVLVVILALMYTLLTDASSIASSVSNRGLKRLFSKTYQYFSLYFPAVLLLRVHKAASKKQRKVILILASLMIAYVTFTTWNYLQNNPNAAREWAGFEEISKLNVANYYYIIAYPVVVAIFTVCFVKLKTAPRILAVLAIVTILEFLIMSQYTLSILIAVIAILYQISQSIRSVSGKVIYATAMIVLALFVPALLELAIGLIPYEQVTIRLSEINDFISGRGADGYNLNSRLTLYWKSIVAFITSPIWGNRKLDFDGHATFLTVLADTGILGGIPFYYLLTMIVKNIRGVLDKNHKPFNTVILVVVLMGLTNPIHPSLPIGITAWFLAPLTIMTILNKENKYAAV